MKKIFLENNELQGDFIKVNSEESNHIMNALRLKIGDEIFVSNEDDKEYITEISDYSEGIITLKIKDIIPLQKSELGIILYQGLCKGDKMDFIIQKATEIGISSIVPIETMRTIVKLDQGKSGKKTERWQKIASEAAKQSNAPFIPKIGSDTNIKEMINNLEKDVKYILFWEEEKNLKLREALNKISEKRIALIIGPEGGFDEEEVSLLKGKGVISVSLGEKILRTEMCNSVFNMCNLIL
jgi:16S rRNA (uracil1498-N3)-methyltransferase